MLLVSCTSCPHHLAATIDETKSGQVALNLRNVSSSTIALPPDSVPLEPRVTELFRVKEGLSPESRTALCYFYDDLSWRELVVLAPGAGHRIQLSPKPILKRYAIRPGKPATLIYEADLSYAVVTHPTPRLSAKRFKYRELVTSNELRLEP